MLVNVVFDLSGRLSFKSYMSAISKFLILLKLSLSSGVGSYSKIYVFVKIYL